MNEGIWAGIGTALAALLAAVGYKARRRNGKQPVEVRLCAEDRGLLQEIRDGQHDTLEAIKRMEARQGEFRASFHEMWRDMVRRG